MYLAIVSRHGCCWSGRETKWDGRMVGEFEGKGED